MFSFILVFVSIESVSKTLCKRKYFTVQLNMLQAACFWTLLVEKIVAVLIYLLLKGKLGEQIPYLKNL